MISIMKDYELAWFIKLAETQHVTWVADEMDITQPTLSRAIARLEKEIGAPLFSREGRRLQLNECGRTFYEYALSAITELEVGKNRVTEVARQAQHQVRIGTLHGLVPIMIQMVVEPFHSLSPDTIFYFRLGSPLEIINELEHGYLDFILTTTKPDSREQGWITIDQEVFYLAVGPNHRLANRNQANLSEVASDDFIVMRSGTAIRNLIMSLCRQAGFSPKVVLESSEIAPIRTLVAHGIGISIIPMAYTKREPENVKYLDISDESGYNRRDVGVAWKLDGSRSATLDHFREFLFDTFIG